MKLHQTTKCKLNLLYVCLLGIGILSSMLVIPSSNNFAPLYDMAPESAVIISDDYHSNHNLVVPILGHDYVSWSLSSGNGIYGNFEVTVPSSGADQIINFFICDQDNFDLWEDGDSASVYHSQENVGSYSFHFRVPHADTWYFVFKNYAIFSTKTINLDLYRDLTPPSIDMNLDAGATYTGVKEITAAVSEVQFSINEVKLYIDGSLKDTETDSSFSYSWNTAQYSNGAHTIRISASDNVGNSGYEELTVLVANVIPTTSSTTTNTGDDGNDDLPFISPFMLASLLGIVGLIVVAGIVVRSRSGTTLSPISGDLETVGSEKTTSTHVKERVVSERFLVICPFCGTKNEQGTISCQGCGAKL